MASFLMRSLVITLPLALSACGGDVEATSSGGAGGSGGDGGGGAGTVTSSAPGGSGGDGGSGGAGGDGGATTTSTASTTDPNPDVCVELAALTLSNPKVVDASGDGKWSPGELAQAFVTMTNPTNMDVDYPGVVWSSDNPLVFSESPYNAFFLIFAGESSDIDVPFQVDPAAPIGAKATLTVRLVDISGNVCDELPAETLDVVVE